ncbi:MAG: succinyldiaminopimelate transaminase [Porticoccaceae bacterium]|nr:succinyldiaminopimelate transaminase [Porticoccaceae bacterium]
MNPALLRLQEYPFERLKKLLDPVSTNSKFKSIKFSVGEPRHKPPKFVLQALSRARNDLGYYPTIKGSSALRITAAGWLENRYNLASGSIDPDTQILPVNGTREGIFSFTQACINPKNTPLVVTCNPFYQIYEGAAILAGAELWYLDCHEDNYFLPDLSMVPAKIWERCQILHFCTPGNPTGSCIGIDQMCLALQLAEKYDFIIVSDECYSEIYFDETSPPIGLLEACKRIGNDEFKRCIIFHSLSKRSNLPGLRSGCVSGDRALIEQFLLYRTYHGCAMSPATQAASIAAWRDESHVIKNRKNYREKFDKVTAALQPTLEFFVPRASFYLWPKTPIDDVKFCRDLYQSKNVTVLPGQYMGRTTSSGNPGMNRIRMALVAELDDCMEAAERIVNYVEGL